MIFVIEPCMMDRALWIVVWRFKGKLYFLLLFKIVNIWVFIEFNLFTKQEGTFEHGTRTDTKVSSQGIQRDQFRQFWSSVQEVMNI